MPTINDDDVVSKLKWLGADLVIVNGTSVINNHVLESVNIPFINTRSCNINIQKSSWWILGFD